MRTLHGYSMRALHDGWTLAPAPDSRLAPPAVFPVPAGPAMFPGPAGPAMYPVPAVVPGCVHTDLLAAGVIADPLVGDNELRQAWIGRTDWVYETVFDWSGADNGSGRADLVCAGLDTVATVSLNGVELGSTANMHRGYRFDARAALRRGENRLRVRLDSAYGYAERLRDRLGDRPNAYLEPFPFIRKMACNFGWDWGPCLVTAGIWQPIGLHEWSVARLAGVHPLVTLEDGTWRVEVRVEVERAGAHGLERGRHTRLIAGGVPPTLRGDEQPLRVDAAVAGAWGATTIEPGQRIAVLTLLVDDPALWWPRGYGEPSRHALELTLRSADGTVLDAWRRSIGFRTVRLDTSADEHGSAFTLVVNDVPIFVRGANWIPDDVFVTRVDRARYRERLLQACDANVNYLRVWGGGRYESDDFYDLADEFGLLVGQDFLFACAAYPEEEPLRSEVAAEAREQIVRLAPHPSLVVWTGNNENVWGYHDWDWQEPLSGRSWGAGYYFKLLPDLLTELDPTRPYWPGSPYSGDGVHPNDPAHGSTHIWDVWNERDYEHYRAWRPRFVAEFGYQGPPAHATLCRAVGPPLAADSAAMAHRQRAADGATKLRRGLAAHLPVPRDFDDWHYLTQVNQARAISVGVEHFRSLRPLCMGTVVWQLNDCWPVISWSAIDGDGRRKPLWYALRRAYADRLLTIQPRGGGLALVAVNDGLTPWSVTAAVTRLTLFGEPRAKAAVELHVPALSAATVPLTADLTTCDDRRHELLIADARGDRTMWFFAEDRDIGYPPPDYDAAVAPTEGGALVTVTAHTLLRDLTLYPDRLDPDATVDEVMVTLLPGESTTFTVLGGAPLDPAALTTRPVLRCVNDLAAPLG